MGRSRAGVAYLSGLIIGLVVLLVPHYWLGQSHALRRLPLALGVATLATIAIVVRYGTGKRHLGALGALLCAWLGSITPTAIAFLMFAASCDENCD